MLHHLKMSTLYVKKKIYILHPVSDTSLIVNFAWSIAFSFNPGFMELLR